MTYEVKSLNEECGVFGIWGHPDAAKLTVIWGFSQKFSVIQPTWIS